MTDTPAANGQGKTVYLHIGTPKSGTTYLQDVLANNRDKLAERGVLWPRGGWVRQVHAARDLANINPHNHKAADVAGAWQRLANEINAWQGHTAIVSMEWLVSAGPKQVKRAVDSLAPATVKVVITGRDLARIIPASWQESMQNWSSFTWDDYIAALADPESSDIEAGQRMWRQQDIGAILRRWNKVIPMDRMHVVTVPPPGSDSGVLWQRFAEVLGIDPDDYDATGNRQNTSLGVVSAELMRRVNGRAKERGLGWKSSERLVKQVLAKRVLTTRSRDESSLALPADLHPWVVEQSKRIVTEVEQTGVRVWGDLAELIPDPAHAREGTIPETVTDGELLDAALDGIVGMVEEVNGILDRLKGQRAALRRKLDDAEQQLQHASATGGLRRLARGRRHRTNGTRPKA